VIPSESLIAVTAALLAHQGGWDEVLMVLVPIAIFAVLLVVANRRANSIDDQRHRDDDDRAGRPDRHPDGPAAR
jgi:hypothetical protein